MKTSKIVLLLTAAFILCFSSCQNDLVPVPDNDMVQFSEDEDELLKCGRIGRTVPFRGRYTTYPEIIGSNKEGDLTVSIPGDGNATHLGKSTWFSKSIVHATIKTPPWRQTGPMIFEKKGTSDKLIGFFEGTSEPNPPNPFIGSGNYVITHGTGRFRGVTGTGTYTYVASPEMVGDLTFTGTLTFPKRNRHRR